MIVPDPYCAVIVGY